MNYLMGTGTANSSLLAFCTRISGEWNRLSQWVNYRDGEHRGLDVSVVPVILL